MAEEENELVTVVKKAATLDNFQKYVMGYKKNGQPRAIWDVVKKYGKKKSKRKKGDEKSTANSFSFYLGSKKKKGKGKHWKF